jgi:hypothetical protein
MGLASQMNPDYIWQVEEHPSPFAVFPSSHCSVGIKMKSPQTVWHFPETALYPCVHEVHWEVETGHARQWAGRHVRMQMSIVLFKA